MLPVWLLWLLPVPVATLAAIAWTAWSSRPRRPDEPAATVRDYERFRAAMSTPVPPAEHERR
ncbi:MAG: hypothetical protein JWN17_2493 [Frankiales bacterium]|nr:hypothetical protein [Frankiales bacterium]